MSKKGGKKKLSIVYSSHLGEEYDKAFEEHIRDTIGLPDKLIEILRYENDNEYSLTEVYQMGLKDSQADLVIFTHNDVLFDTEGWGKRLMNHFKKTDYGILGVAGTTHLSENGQWWADRGKMCGVVNHQKGNKKWTNAYSAVLPQEILDVVVVDGVFFAVDKTKIKYDFDEYIEGFHFYDIDFCLGNYLEDVKIGVVFDFRITHKSMGETNTEWEYNRQMFIQKWGEQLPQSLEPRVIAKTRKVKTNNNLSLAIIIPTKENYGYLFDCVESIKKKTKHSNYNIYIADTGSEESTKGLIREELLDDKSHLIEYDYYNFAKINNNVVNNHTQGEDLLLFCNNDVTLVNNAIDVLLDEYRKFPKEVGTVGARLHFGDNSIQHAGVYLQPGQNGEIRLGHLGLRTSYGWFNGINSRVVGNTAAFMLTKRSTFDEIGGFNEEYIECFEDVEYNLECRYMGMMNITVSDAVCYHYESVTRNLDESKMERQNEDLNKRLVPFLQNKEKEMKERQKKMAQIQAQMAANK